MDRTELLNQIKQFISKETGIGLQEIQESDTFFSLGLDSISSIFIMDKIEGILNHELNPIHFWDYPTLGDYVDFLILDINRTEKN